MSDASGHTLINGKTQKPVQFRENNDVARGKIQFGLMRTVHNLPWSATRFRDHINSIGGQAGDIMPITRTSDRLCGFVGKRQGNSAGYDFVWSGHDGGV